MSSPMPADSDRTRRPFSFSKGLRSAFGLLGRRQRFSFACRVVERAAVGFFDLLLAGANLRGGEKPWRTPAYDCAANKWISLKITGDDPSGPEGRNVSLGLMYDAKRKLFWAVDTNSEVYVLKLDPASAEPKDL